MECFEQKSNCFEQSKLLKYEGVTVEESWNNEGLKKISYEQIKRNVKNIR